MYTITVRYFGKDYMFHGDSIACVDWMVGTFGRVTEEQSYEWGSHGRTAKGAEFWLQES